MTSTDQPSKQEAFLTFLQDGWVTIYVDARHSDVVVPPHLKGESRLVLQYGLNMPVPVEDLQVTEAGVKATLSFARQPHDTLIPWPAIYVIACTDGRGVLYKEDVPAELMAEVSDEETASTHGDKDEPPTHLPSTPRSASAGGGAAAHAHAVDTSDEQGGDPPAEKPKPRRRLKSVPMPQMQESASAESNESDEGTHEPEPEAPKPPLDEPPKGSGRPKLRLVK